MEFYAIADPNLDSLIRSDSQAKHMMVHQLQNGGSSEPSPLVWEKPLKIRQIIWE